MYRWCGLVQLSREILLNIQRSSKHPRCQAHFITKNFPLSYFLCLSADFAKTMRNDVKWSYRHSCQHLEFSISNISVKLNIPLFKNVKIIIRLIVICQSYGRFAATLSQQFHVNNVFIQKKSKVKSKRNCGLIALLPTTCIVEWTSHWNIPHKALAY